LFIVLGFLTTVAARLLSDVCNCAEQGGSAVDAAKLTTTTENMILPIVRDRGLWSFIVKLHRELVEVIRRMFGAYHTVDSGFPRTCTTSLVIHSV
jgi:hypothetical protein